MNKKIVHLVGSCYTDISRCRPTKFKFMYKIIFIKLYICNVKCRFSTQINSVYLLFSHLLGGGGLQKWSFTAPYFRKPFSVLYQRFSIYFQSIFAQQVKNVCISIVHIMKHVSIFNFLWHVLDFDEYHMIHKL